MRLLALNKNSLSVNVASKNPEGFKVFIYFIFSVALSQLFYNVINFISIFFLVCSIGFIAYVLIKGRSTDILFFLVFTSLMRLTIPFTQEKEFSLIIPLLCFGAIFIKRIRRLDRLNTAYVNGTNISLALYFIIVIITFFYGLEIPKIRTTNAGGNTGFIGRWTLINTLFVFLSVVMSFKIEYLETFIKKLYKFYSIVLIISLVMFILDIHKLPLFNTFSWSVISESENSKRMGIAGVAAIMVLIYMVCFQNQYLKRWYLFIPIILGIIFSGGRSVFLCFLIIVYCGWAVKNKFLGRSFIIILVGTILFVVFSLSPLILYTPAKLQRSLIIFPSHFYTGSLKQLGRTAAASSSDFRIQMWKRAYPSIKTSPLTGNGFGVPQGKYNYSKDMVGFNKISQEILITDFKSIGNLHNTYISLAYLMGIPALLLFSFSYIKTIIKAYLLSINRMINSTFRNYLIFFVLLLLSYFVLSLFGDLHLATEFFIYLAVIIKTLNIYNIRLKKEYISNFNTDVV